MLTGLHILLTYKCIFECDHCFVYSSPDAEGTFTLQQIKKVLEEAVKIGTIQWIYFEGGEPFLYYPVMLEGLKLAKSNGFKTGIVTNAFYANTVEDAEVWLKPLIEFGISDLSISDDTFHSGDEKETPAKYAIEAAKKLGLPVGSICIEEPKIEYVKDSKYEKGQPVIGGDVMFKGRAVDKLITDDLPRRNWKEFNECPYEELEKPDRVHLDAYGNVHICQGISIGNMWKTPLSEIIQNYNAKLHPICAPLKKGGPAELCRKFKVEHEEGYIDACHLCYNVRKALLERFPKYLEPKQVYGK